ncbi:MAG: hypothetical protein QOH57_2948 [Mycobacterium sp.]|jgi:uncharacterized protein YjbI with pentapeptide repeats|nr:hypothetical protein [Mycobacterium sp.]
MMAGRRNRQREVPDPPSLPGEFVAATGDFARITEWDGLIADSALTLPDIVHDLTMTECVWRGVDASSRTFTNLHCRDVVFEQCHFGGAILDSCVLTRVAFIECRLTGVVLSGAQLTDVVIDGGVAHLANLRSSVSSFLWVTGTGMKEADFYDARLHRSALLDCDLSSASFDSASVHGLSLHGSVLDSLRGTPALTGADVGLEAHQLVPMGAAVLAEMGVRVTDRPQPSR